jgi:hypothetical protein
VSEKGGGIENWKGKRGEERDENENKEGFENWIKDAYLEWMNLMGWEEKRNEFEGKEMIRLQSDQVDLSFQKELKVEGTKVEKTQKKSHHISSIVFRTQIDALEFVFPRSFHLLPSLRRS